MAGLCEGGNEPPSSLKAIQLEGSLVRHCKEEISKNANWPLHRNFSRRSEEEIQLTAIKEESNTEQHTPTPTIDNCTSQSQKSAVVQETLKTMTNSVETGRLSKLPQSCLEMRLMEFLEFGKDAATLPPRGFDGSLSILLNKGCDWLLRGEDKISVTVRKTFVYDNQLVGGSRRVISLLYKLDILPFRLIQRCLKHFTEEGSEESLECLCVLLTLLGKDLESQNKEGDAALNVWSGSEVTGRASAGKMLSTVAEAEMDYETYLIVLLAVPVRSAAPDLSEYFNEIQKLSDKDDEDFFLSRYRLKCMLQLKKNKWVPLTEEKEKEILHMCETVTKNTSINQDQMNESIAASLFDTNMSTYSHQEKAVFTTSPSLSSITSSPAESLKVDEQKGSVISSSSVSPLAQSLKVDEQKEALVSSISKSSPVQSLKVDEQKGALVSSISTSPPVQNQKIDKQKDSIVSNVSISPLAESMEIGEQKDALFGNTSTSLPVQSLKIDEQKGALDRSITTPPPVQSLNESVPESTFRRLPAPTFSFDELMNYDKLEEPVNSTISMSELARRLNVDVEELFGSISKSLLDQNLKVDGQKKSVISNVSISPLAQSLKVDEQKEALVSSISQSPPVQSLKVDEQMEALVSSISTSPTVQTLKVDGQKESTVSNISVSPLPQSLKIDKQEEALVSIISTSPPVQSSKVDEQKETLVSSILRSPPVQNLKVDEQKESVVSSVSIFPPSQSLKVDEQKEALVSSILRSPPVQNMKVDEQKESVVNSVSIFPPSQSLKVDEQKEALVSSILRSPPVQNVKVDEQKESVVNSVSIFPPSQSLKVDEQKEALVSSILRSLPVQNMKVDEQKASLVSSVSIFPPSQSLKVDEQKETLVSSILRSPPVQNLKVDEQKESVVNSASIFPPSQSLKVDEQKETLGSSILRSLPVQNLKVDEQKESIVNSVSISPSSQRPNVCEQTGTIVSCLSSSSLAQSPIGEKPMGVINSCAFTSLAATNLGNNAEKETVCKSEVTPPSATDMKVIENDMKKEDKPVTSACTAITESNMLHQVVRKVENVKGATSARLGSSNVAINWKDVELKLQHLMEPDQTNPVSLKQIREWIDVSKNKYPSWFGTFKTMMMLAVVMSYKEGPECELLGAL
ncbi:hypothetical protein ANN_16140 [Periplaneta americana]|uniref:Uncharacterized protein n=1 Tax=Periplaneta americana TaxID=6978 RepID=A0ABQ8SI50_PERAM|nr:hypothetical protein ANN_16140 [Periplaneta americana]